MKRAKGYRPNRSRAQQSAGYAPRDETDPGRLHRLVVRRRFRAGAKGTQRQPDLPGLEGLDRDDEAYLEMLIKPRLVAEPSVEYRPGALDARIRVIADRLRQRAG